MEGVATVSYLLDVHALLSDLIDQSVLKGHVDDAAVPDRPYPLYIDLRRVGKIWGTTYVNPNTKAAAPSIAIDGVTIPVRDEAAMLADIDRVVDKIREAQEMETTLGPKLLSALNEDAMRRLFGGGT